MGSGSDQKLIELSQELRSSLAPIVGGIAGPGVRPALLVRRLEIDRTLAGRLARALRAEDDLEFLHLLPAPTGLRIFLGAAARSGEPVELLDPAEKSVDRFHALIDETPGGRATLDAGISAHSQQARERSEKSARQAAYKAMSYLLGIQCDGIATAFIMHPADDGKTVDTVDLSLKAGMRRLRPTSPIGLFGYRTPDAEGTEVSAPPFTTLDQQVVQGAEDLILRDFSSEHLPGLEAFETGPETTIALSGDGPPQDSPLTLALGTACRGMYQQYRTPGCEDDFRAYMVAFPCRTLVRDVFVHETLHGGAVPEVTQYMPRKMRPETVRYKGERGTLDRVDMAAVVEHLGPGLGNTAVKQIPSYRRLLEHGFEKAGWDAARFRGYRVRVTYPVPFIYMSWWFDLPEAPEGA